MVPSGPQGSQKWIYSRAKVVPCKVYKIQVYGYSTAESISRLRNWHNKRIREMCRVTMCQSFVHQISSASLQKRMSTTSQAALYSGLATSHACLRVGYPKGSCFRGYTSRG